MNKKIIIIKDNTKQMIEKQIIQIHLIKERQMKNSKDLRKNKPENNSNNKIITINNKIMNNNSIIQTIRKKPMMKSLKSAADKNNRVNIKDNLAKKIKNTPIFPLF